MASDPVINLELPADNASGYGDTSVVGVLKISVHYRSLLQPARAVLAQSPSSALGPWFGLEQRGESGLAASQGGWLQRVTVRQIPPLSGKTPLVIELDT